MIKQINKDKVLDVLSRVYIITFCSIPFIGIGYLMCVNPFARGFFTFVFVVILCTILFFKSIDRIDK